MTPIPFIDDKVLLVGGLVAGSERCRCFCDAECLSITFDGFGPGGDPCIACGNIDGTYTLERRGTDNASGPWVYSYCGDSACLVEGDPGCLEIILTLSCSQHTLSVLFCGSEILSATASNDGTKCDELTFTGAVGETCNPIGTITTGPAECGESSEQRCCDCPPCGIPEQWAIVDITTGFEILLQGLVIPNQTIFGLPPGWLVKSWNTAPMPAALRFGLFVLRTHQTNCLECAAWIALETWTVVPKKCSGGDWHSQHTFAASYPFVRCDSNISLSVYFGDGNPQYSYDTMEFNGTVDCEWSNLSNWELPVGVTPWLINLPSETTAVRIFGELLGNAIGDAECKTLEMTLNSKLGIYISVAETASVSGTVVRACAIPCDTTGCCNPQSVGHIDAIGDVTVAGVGVNQGEIDSQGAISCAGINYGKLAAENGIEFLDSGENRGFLSAATGTGFRNYSKNYDPVPLSECEWVEYFSPAIQGAVEFSDHSQNFGSGFQTGVSIKFVGDSSNASEANISTAVSFSDDAVNYGSVGSGSTFSGNSINAANHGTVNGASTFEDNAANHGTVSGASTFQDNTANHGTVGSGSTFSGNSNNASTGVVNGDATFSNNTVNYGAVSGTGTFNMNAVNDGTVSGDAFFSSNAVNEGTVSGAATFESMSVNNGSIQGNATFSGSAVNQGTVNGNATFNGNSSNLGTVLGTITCNTTGTCSEQ